MELSNYKVEIIGGRHMSQPASNSFFGGSPFTFPSPFSASSPFSNSFSSSFWTSPIDTVTNKSTDKSYVEMKDNEHYLISIYNGHSSRCHAKITIDGKHVGTWILEPWGSARLERPVDIQKKFTFFKVNSVAGAEAGLVKGDSKNGLVCVEFIPEVQVRSNFFERCLGPSSSSSEKTNSNNGSLRDLGINNLDNGWGEDSLEFDDDFDCLSADSLSSDRRGRMGYNSRLGGNRREIRGSTRSLGFGGDRGVFPQSQSFNSSRNLESANNFEAGGTGLKGRSHQDFKISNEKMQLDYNSKVTINLRLVARKDDFDSERVTPLSMGARSNAVPPPIF